MSGAFFPSNYVEGELGLRSLFEGRAATQFNHRFLAYVIWGLSLACVVFKWGQAGWREVSTIAVLITLQAMWGIVTLVHGAPLELAIVHQALGVIVFTACVRLVWLTAPQRELSEV